MELKNATLTPGVITDVSDPKKIGRVKASVPGIFDANTMQKETLPWIYPLTMSNINSFSTPAVGSKIWVLNNLSNYMEFYYIPYFELNSTTNNIKDNYDNAEVILNRTDASGKAIQVYYNDAEGIVLTNASSTISILPTGDITMINNSNNNEVSIKDGNIYIGKKDATYEATVLGEQLKTLLSNLNNGIKDLATKTQASPYTSQLFQPISNISTQLSQDIEKILSNQTKNN